MYIEYLKKIRNQAQLYGDEMQLPCTISQIEDLNERVMLHLRTIVPRAYSDFLMLHNGLDWNGLVIYASEPTPIIGYSDRLINGFVEANVLRRETNDREELLILGDSGDEDYCYDVQQSRFVIVDSTSIDVLESFRTFDELMVEALKHRM